MDAPCNESEDSDVQFSFKRKFLSNSSGSILDATKFISECNASNKPSQIQGFWFNKHLNMLHTTMLAKGHVDVRNREIMI